MEFLWNDGGRAACGFVGLTGDCVTRSIAIATGGVYRDVYQALGKASEKTPRNGVPTAVAADYLSQRGWQAHSGNGRIFHMGCLPKGVVVVSLCDAKMIPRHFCAVIDHVIHDTWNPAEDSKYFIDCFWTSPEGPSDSRLPRIAANRPVSQSQQLTQQEFDKILKRLRALDNTALNDASTEGEKHNALRMMQDLLLRHNLTREDIVDQENVESVHYTRVACPVNGLRVCTWEASLARYLTIHIFRMVQYYVGSLGHRKLFWFYGPKADVDNALALFRELLLTIATSAKLRYGSYSRGSGASYAEGYVAGLPQSPSETSTAAPTGHQNPADNRGGLIQARTLAMHSAAREWLNLECGIQLVTTRRAGRYLHDPAAERQGKQHGAQHDLRVPGSLKRLN